MKNSTKETKGTKTEFVLGLPKNLPGADVVEKAKAAGIKIDTKYVYNIRSAAKAASRNKAKAAALRRAPPKVKAADGASPRSGPVPFGAGPNTRAAEGLLRAVAAELGIGAAISILENERKRVLAILKT